MPTRINKFLITTGIITLIQAAFQTVYASFALAQYFCVIDFLRTYPLLIFIRILYFHKSGTRKHHSNHSHWPWLIITLAVTLLDVIAVITFANDSFHTKTLEQIMQYINGSASGIGNTIIWTEWAAWLMVLIYSRFVVLLLVNAFLMVYAVVDCTRFRSSATSSEIERNQVTSFEANSDDKESDEVTTRSPSVEVARIPRPGLSQSFRTMKNFLFNRTASPQAGSTNSINGGRTRNRAVNFPEEIEMTPTFENLIVEQHRRLHTAIIDTSGRRSPGQGSRLTRTLSFNNLPETSRGRRGTAVELQGQMPWSYMPAPANRMRDQLPPDEDLPPVPLPDYTAIQSARKASVHRAASSLSSITQKKEYNTSYPSPHPMATRFDVLY
ncbi:uncharacterized protein isoform X2 [Choristoneura fumiferana]|uniref:uncharacterized protein isoform X2 n=1 Tax=Choristoneura fumiferana TaxID=7141 RepID=UPI003D15EFE3